MIVAGIDAGSRSVKALLLDADTTQVLARDARDQGIDQMGIAEDLLECLLAKCSLQRSDVAATIATGYGRKLIRFADRNVTEITCHAKGVRHLSPDTRTVIEVGGQDSKLIHLSEDGAVFDFVMNDRCAAGTGRFLEMAAAQLGLRFDELADSMQDSTTPAAISSMCVVFAETEIVGLLAEGVAPPDIMAGVLASVAQRVASLGGNAVQGPVMFTGGVAMIPGMHAALCAALDQPAVVAPDPQFSGALGAALLAAAQS